MAAHRHMEPEPFGPYTLVRHLATGGMGELFLAQRAGLAGFSKQLVVKRIRSELATDREFVDMFLSEGRIAALLDHPNVVHIYDLGEEGGIFYMAMEYIAGRDLGSLLHRNGGPLDLPLALYLMISLCEGLAFAHDAVGQDGHPLELVHRDINPQNVLISYQGSVSITDFGIAKVRAWQQHTRAGVLKGKFGYLAPEQARSDPIDRRTDIYALGLLLFETTIGQRAIPGHTDTELLYAAAEGLTRRPSELSRDYPRRLEQIFFKATAKHPEERYQDVRELQEDLVTFQMEQRLVVTPSKLASLMQRLFATEWSDERKLLTPTSARGAQSQPGREPSQPASGQHSLTREPSQPSSPSATRQPSYPDSGLHSKPTVLRGNGSAPKEPSAREFVNAPTLHDFGSDELDQAPGREGSNLDVTAPELPASPGGRESSDLAATAPELPGNVTARRDSNLDATVPDLPNYDGPTAEAIRPAISAVQTSDRDGAARQPEPSLAAAETRVLARDDEQPLRGDRTRDEILTAPAPLQHRARWPIIVISTLITLLVGGAVAYYVMVLRPASRADARRAAAPADAAAGSPAGAAGVDGGAGEAAVAVARPLTPDAAVVDAASLARTEPDTGTAAQPRTGHLEVRSDPVVRVLWRGRRLGRTPLKAKVAVGRQRLLLVNPQLGIRVSRHVTVRATGLTRLETRLRQGTLVVKARPWAHVEVDGVRKGTTPMRPIKLYEGAHKIKLINTDKQQTHSQRIVIRPDKETRLIHRFQ